jgi:hypothetical protein
LGVRLRLRRKIAPGRAGAREASEASAARTIRRSLALGSA